MDLHRLGEHRSRAYHRAIAARLTAEPAMVERALARLEAWQATKVLDDRLAERWREVLRLAVDRLRDRLVDDDEEMTLLRSVSPFAGELSPRERWQIWEAVREASP